MTMIKNRLNKLREIMNSHDVDFYLAPSIDPHCNEYLPTCWLRRPWISGFTGSAGEALIGRDHAYLWTDGRYYLQANQQLDANEYTLMHQSAFTPETESWLNNECSGKTLGVDPKLISIRRAQKLQKILKNNGGKLKLSENNLIDQCKIALGEKLAMPNSAAFILDEKYAGESVTSKLCWLRGELKHRKADYLVLTALDEIAWLFNLRGSDIDYNPLVISYAIVGVNAATLFVDATKIDAEVASYLKNNGVKTTEYDSFINHLQSITGTFWLDDKTTSYWVYERLNSDKNNLLLETSPIIHRRACKNNVEQEGARIAHARDSVALIGFLSWLKNNWQSGVDELSAIPKLAEFRLKQQNLIGFSFDTKSGFASNSAVIHYDPTPETNKVIDDTNMYLLDSGGQYLEGTTDVTRTLHMGTPTAEQKRHYTLVLKGHLGLGRTKFPHRTCGEHLDAIARYHLWQDNLNYAHGTGHGVGSFLCVHEGPHKISQSATNAPLVPGMVVSNEPGFYRNGHYGIRIENLCLVVEDKSNQDANAEYGPFYKFETLTLAPYCKNLIDLNLLTVEEKQQITDYYSVIRQKIMPLLNSEEQQWLTHEMDLEFA